MLAHVARHQRVKLNTADIGYASSRVGLCSQSLPPPSQHGAAKAYTLPGGRHAVHLRLHVPADPPRSLRHKPESAKHTFFPPLSKVGHLEGPTAGP
jgi:hypothetical protein